MIECYSDCITIVGLTITRSERTWYGRHWINFFSHNLKLNWLALKITFPVSVSNQNAFCWSCFFKLSLYYKNYIRINDYVHCANRISTIASDTDRQTQYFSYYSRFLHQSLLPCLKEVFLLLIICFDKNCTVSLNKL